MKDAIETIIKMRTNKISHEIMKDDNYSQCNEIIEALINKINNAVCSDSTIFINELSDNYNCRETIAEEIMYKKGIEDGISLSIEAFKIANKRTKNAQHV